MSESNWEELGIGQEVEETTFPTGPVKYNWLAGLMVFVSYMFEYVFAKGHGMIQGFYSGSNGHGGENYQDKQHGSNS